MPTNVPTMEPMATGRRIFLTSSQLGSTRPNREAAERMFPSARFATISGTAKRPTSAGMKWIPASMFASPKVKRAVPTRGSIPTVTIMRPRKVDSSPLTSDFAAKAEMTDMPKNTSPNRSAAWN